MADFKQALDKLLDLEGRKLTNDASDRGGETQCGISKRSFPNWPGWNLKGDYTTSEGIRTAVMNLYFDEFWTPLHCDEMPQAIADKLLDMAVNLGRKTAVEMLQRALGFTELNIDGIVGPMTVGNVLSSKCEELLIGLRARQLRRYFAIVHADESQTKFLDGWIRRALV